MLLKINATKSEGPCIWEILIVGLVVAFMLAALTLGVTYSSVESGAEPVEPAAPAAETTNTRVEAPAPAAGQHLHERE